MSKLTIGSKTKTKLTCNNCGKRIPAGKQHTYQANDGSDYNMCANCKVQLAATIEAESKSLNTAKAFFYGFVAATLGGLAWYFIALFTGYEIGLVAIAIGYLVIKAILMGSGNRTTTSLQITGMILTLLAIVGANYFLGVHYIHEQMLIDYPKDDELIILISSLIAAAIGFFQYAISPIGLFIWGIALYVVYGGLKPIKI